MTGRLSFSQTGLTGLLDSLGDLPLDLAKLLFELRDASRVLLHRLFVRSLLPGLRVPVAEFGQREVVRDDKPVFRGR